MKNSLISLLVLFILFYGCKETPSNNSRVEYLPYYDEADFTPKWHNPGDKALNDFHQIAPFSLVNQEGDTITENTFKDKIYVVDFFFTICPGICPKLTEHMGILQDEFLDNPDILLLSHSVTPEIDSVPRLKEYAVSKGVDSKKWHLATGDVKQIYRLGRKEYFIEEDLGLEKEEDEFLHTENFVLIDKNRHIRGIYNGLKTRSIEQLITDIETLKMER